MSDNNSDNNSNNTNDLTDRDALVRSEVTPGEQTEHVDRVSQDEDDAAYTKLYTDAPVAAAVMETGFSQADKQSNPAARTDLDFDAFRKRLLEEKALAEETINKTVGNEGDDEEGTAGTARTELSVGADNHPADVATELFQREQDMALERNAKDILAKIGRALEKLDEGTYGLSDRSGEPIPAERLEALPYATLTASEMAVEEAI